jgi:hypothetical protein
MKISSGPGAVKRTTAMNCLLVNQLATPGLGSLMGRRFLEGIVQLILALLGAGFFIGGFIQLGLKTYRMMNDQPEQPEHYPWLTRVGVILFVTSWLLAWITSLSLLRNARAEKSPTPITPVEPPAPRRIPPKL